MMQKQTMTNPSMAFIATSGPGTEFDKLVDLFGGPNVLKHPVSGSIEAHDMILHGIPSQALANLVHHLIFIERLKRHSA